MNPEDPGNGGAMTENVDREDQQDDPRVVVLQAVVDRVTSWQEGSDEDTVRSELDSALAEADVDVDEGTRQRIVERVTSESPHFDVREVL
ncbi:MAG: hypothetical protein QOK15_3410 [Nocardioidaceae bacterium]|nr:hypothetical protein [Nocardioidaceae bacterium]